MDYWYLSFFIIFLFQGLLDLYVIPLFTVVILHIITIILAKKEGVKTYANYIGILTTLVAFFPYIHIVLHLIAATFLLLDAASTNIKKGCEL